MSANGVPKVVLRVERYELFDAIASGGMATVHLARMKGGVGFSRMVAVKRLHPNFAKDVQFRAMLIDEARLVSRIRHHNIVQTLDIVALDDELFLAMDYVHGSSLASCLNTSLKRNEDVPLPVIGAIICETLHGLHAAHNARGETGQPLGIIHRDVSPQNILVGADGVTRVIDFGVAKAEGQSSSTRDGELKGKLTYMSPEQLQSQTLTPASDVYAVGVVLWELLAMRKLFDADTPVGNLHRIISTLQISGLSSMLWCCVPYTSTRCNATRTRMHWRKQSKKYCRLPPPPKLPNGWRIQLVTNSQNGPSWSMQ
jgi:eukaryotic-like serine/threonine-protein kinase